MPEKKSFWQVLWDYDPNALVVVNPDMIVTTVNPAFCRMFSVEEKDIIGHPLSRVLDDSSEFQAALTCNQIRGAEKKEYPRYGLYVRRLLFPIRQEHAVAAIFVDLTNEWKERQNVEVMKQHVIDEVNTVINEQMLAVQEIAKLLGETAARSKISLHKLTGLINENTV